MDRESLVKHILASQKKPMLSPKAALIHSQQHRDVSLQDRQAARSAFKECLSTRRINFGLQPMPDDRTQFPMPVFSGMKGLGKTRMLEEWEGSFQDANIPHPYLGLIVTYGNGHGVNESDRSLPIEASFAWRVLHRLFILDNDNDTSKGGWVGKGFLPTNAKELTMSLMLDVVYALAQEFGFVKQGEVLSLFIGIDEYQAIPKGGAYEKREKHTNEAVKLRPYSNLWRIISVFDQCRVQSKQVRLYPAFAGTKFGPLSIAGSSVPDMKRAPLSFLCPEAMEDAIRPICHDRLKDDQFRRELFFLGGIPRPSIEYAQRGKEAFQSIWSHRISSEWIVSTTELLLLISYALSRTKVQSEDKPGIKDLKWYALADQGLCLIEDDEIVTVPYCVFRLAAERTLKTSASLVEKCLLQNLQFLVNRVDASLYCAEPWQQWESFGAFFFASRVNSFIRLGVKTVKVKSLCEGAVVNGCNQLVDLHPMEVRQIVETLDTDLGKTVTGTPERQTLNWVDGDDGVHYCLINGTSGEGVDIFCALHLNKSDRVLFYADQRKRVASALGVVTATDLIQKAAIVPVFLGEDADYVLGLFSLLATYHHEASDLFEDSFVLSYAQHQAFHGCLSSHPACSPCVDVNFCNISTLRLLTSVASIAKKIVTARSKQQFESLNGFIDFCKHAGYTLSPQDALRCLVHPSS